MIGDLIAEVLEALFHVIGSSIRTRKWSKKSGIRKNARPAVNGIPPQS